MVAPEMFDMSFPPALLVGLSLANRERVTDQSRANRRSIAGQSQVNRRCTLESVGAGWEM